MRAANLVPRAPGGALSTQDPGPSGILTVDQAAVGGPAPGSPAGAAEGTALQAPSSVPYDTELGNMAARWPALAAHQVEVGGVVVTCAQAAAAAQILAASRTSAIQPVLRAAGHPLACCDYFAAAAPWIGRARAEPKTGRAGAAGRHVTKWAFLAAITARLRRAREEELAGWRSALATDERYAAAIARDAVAVRQRAHAAGIRSALRAAVSRAVLACNASAGQFTCAELTACGTGSCRFAQPPYRAITAAAGPGRLVRPGNHAAAGAGFGETEAAAELTEAVPWRAGVPVSDCGPARGAAA